MQDIDINTTISEVSLFIEKLQADMPEVFKSGKKTPLKKLLYMGKLYDVNLNRGEQSCITFNDDTFTLTAPNFRQHNLKPVIEGWMKTRAQKTIEEKVKHWAEKMELEFNKVSVKDQKSLWGSCSHKGNLNFCWRIIKAPGEVLDYLVIHELAHIKYLNHGEEFWQLVNSHCPENKKSRKWLNQYKERLFVNEDSNDEENQNSDQPEQQSANRNI